MSLLIEQLDNFYKESPDSVEQEDILMNMENMKKNSAIFHHLFIDNLFITIPPPPTLDHHEGMNAAPFVGLLALLGLPACVFCCCKKRVCRKNQAAATTVNTTTLKMDDQMHPPGPPPAYGNLPAPTGPIQVTL